VKLTYQTGIATFIQFLALSFLTLASQLVSVVTTCHKDGSNCISNLITSTILYILVAVVFGSIWLIGSGAQSRRSRRLAQLLICTEGFIGLVALFSLKLSLHGKNVIGIVASSGILALAVWIIILAFRLMRSGGGRVVTQGGNRRRQRKHTIS
jgi:hypothetical protein